jgi:hypothetical protein
VKVFLLLFRKTKEESSSSEEKAEPTLQEAKDFYFPSIAFEDTGPGRIDY